MTDLSKTVQNCFDRTCLVSEIDTSTGIYSIDGLSGKYYRNFINSLISALGTDASYLEVGVFKGSTLCSAVHGNQVRATGIDNFSQFQVQSPQPACEENLAQFVTAGANVTMIDSDFRKVDYATLGKFKVYFFDGPHHEVDQYDGIVMALPALEEEFVLVVDDWNWPQVRSGTFEAIMDNNLTPVLMMEVKTLIDSMFPTTITSGKDSNWHNGYLIAVLKKNPA